MSGSQVTQGFDGDTSEGTSDEETSETLDIKYQMLEGALRHVVRSSTHLVFKTVWKLRGHSGAFLWALHKHTNKKKRPKNPPQALL